MVGLFWEAYNFIVGNPFSRSEIDFIDILKGAETAIYGSRGGNGVIAVYTNFTNAQSPVKRKSGIANFNIPGFYTAKEFYAPDHSTNNMPSLPDIRTTLYWNPTVQVDMDGQAELSFYTCDNLSHYLVSVEGVSYDGRIIRMAEEFMVVE